jgi:uncharacterized protein
MDLFAAENSNNNSKGVSYSAGFFMLIGLALLGLVVGSAIGAGILFSMGNVSLNNLEEALKDPANANAIRLVQVVSVVISMLIPSLIVAMILNRKPLQLLGYRNNFNAKQAGLVLLIVFVSVSIAGALGYLNKELPFFQGWKAEFERLEKEYLEQVSVMVDLKSTGGYIMSLMIMAVLPAVCEETLFRGGLQNFLTRATKKPWLSIIVISILFSLVHFSFYGFLPRLFLGIMLGAIFHYTQNLWLPILAHFLNNAMAVTAMYFAVRQGKDLKSAMNEEMPYYWGLIALPILIFLLIALKRISAPQLAREHNI